MVSAMRTYTARRDIMRQAASVGACRADRLAALGVSLARLIALFCVAGLLVAGLD